MTTNSANRNVAIIITGIILVCVCLCVAVIGGALIFRQGVVRAVPALERILGTAIRDTATSTSVPATAFIPTKTRQPVVSPLPTEAPPPTVVGAPTEPPSVVTVTPALIEPTATGALAQASPTPIPQPTRTLSPQIAAQMDQIQQQVISIRGLQPSGTYTRDVLSPDELRANVIRDFNKENTPEDIHDTVVELAALGLLEPGFDYGTFTINLLSEQIAGYYDNKTKQMYVVGTEFTGIERLTYSHEYTHALQDENFDIQNGLHYDTPYCKQDSERCAGIQALLEGDATLDELDWLQQFATATDKAQIAAFYATLKTPVYDSAPQYMKDDLTFPYDSGLKFVQYLYGKGGWAAVDAAYKDVPVTTEQIMHPELYPDDKPIVVSLGELTTTLGGGWQQVDNGVMGEWYTYLILADGVKASYRLDQNTASTAAAGWGGDSYAAYNNKQNDQTVFVISYQWDTTKDADEFTSALTQYGTQRFGRSSSGVGGETIWSYTGGYSIYQQTGQGTIWVMAPDQGTAESVWAAIGPKY